MHWRQRSAGDQAEKKGIFIICRSFWLLKNESMESPEKYPPAQPHILCYKNPTWPARFILFYA
ncbi:MAG: hypothetical protein RLY31_2991 [Bacteroidota bacterium]|jgi:hypothetical protein